MSGDFKNIGSMVGKTPTRISVNEYEDELEFWFSDGSELIFYHEQDCCEVVTITDINGDWSDLIGHPILVAEERTSIPNITTESYLSQTYTFYTFRGVSGSVDVRWLGESNGYYSESVHMKFRKDRNSKWEYPNTRRS